MCRIAVFGACLRIPVLRLALASRAIRERRKGCLVFRAFDLLLGDWFARMASKSSNNFLCQILGVSGGCFLPRHSRPLVVVVSAIHDVGHGRRQAAWPCHSSNTEELIVGHWGLEKTTPRTPHNSPVRARPVTCDSSPPLRLL